MAVRRPLVINPCRRNLLRRTSLTAKRAKARKVRKEVLCVLGAYFANFAVKKLLLTSTSINNHKSYTIRRVHWRRMARYDLTPQIIGAAIRIHRRLGPGLLESAYEACLAYELQNAGLYVERQKPVPLIYENVKLDCGFGADWSYKTESWLN